jgi:hypothetical protein
LYDVSSGDVWQSWVQASGKIQIFKKTPLVKGKLKVVSINV